MPSSLPASSTCFVSAASSGLGDGVAGWMVMDEDDVRSVLAYRVAEDLGDADDGAVNVASVYLTNAHDLVAGVEQDYFQVLLLQQRHICAHEGEDVFRRSHGDARRLSGHDALAEREGGDHLRRFGGADVLLGAQLCEGSAAERVHSLEPGEQTRGQCDYVFAPAPGAEQDRQKLRVRQRLGPARAQAFAGPLVRRHLANESTVLKGGGSHRRENTAGIAGSERREWHNLEA